MLRRAYGWRRLELDNIPDRFDRLKVAVDIANNIGGATFQRYIEMTQQENTTIVPEEVVAEFLKDLDSYVDVENSSAWKLKIVIQLIDRSLEIIK